MTSTGVVTLSGEVIGSFELDSEEKITITFSKVSNGVSDMLEFASEQGMTLGLTINPDLDEGGV